MAASRQTIERQSDQLVAQAEAIGTLRADRDAARAEIAATRAPASSVDASAALQTVQPSSTPALALRAVWLRWLLALIAALAGAMVEWPR